jgi:hypothetical protein
VALELAFLKAAHVIAGTAEILPWGEEPVPKCSVFETLLVATSSKVRDVRSCCAYCCNLLGATAGRRWSIAWVVRSRWYAHHDHVETSYCVACYICFLSVSLLRLACVQDSNESVSVSVHSVPGILDDALTDWEKAAFGYRYVRVLRIFHFRQHRCIFDASVSDVFLL